MAKHVKIASSSLKEDVRKTALQNNTMISKKRLVKIVVPIVKNVKHQHIVRVAFNQTNSNKVLVNVLRKSLTNYST